MTNENTLRIHWSFWVIGAITLIWNLLGAVNFVVQMDPDSVSAYRETERAIIAGRPAWATLGFALAVFGGTLGSLLLLFRKSASFYFFVASFLGTVVAQFHALRLGIDFGPGEILGIIFMPLILAGFLIWYSRRSQSMRWIM